MGNSRNKKGTLIAKTMQQASTVVFRITQEGTKGEEKKQINSVKHNYTVPKSVDGYMT